MEIEIYVLLIYDLYLDFLTSYNIFAPILHSGTAIENGKNNAFLG